MIYFDFSFEYHHFFLKMAGSIYAGEIVGLLGPSGAGKSTLLRLFAGLEKPQNGKLTVAKKVWCNTAEQIFLPTQKRCLGMVFQDSALFPHMRVKEQILYASNGDHHWVDELLYLMNLIKLSNCYPHALSGGQKQRVALARALARKPRLLLLDEPLNALDQSAREVLQELLRKLHNQYLTYTILVSHDINELLFLTNRIFRCEEGRIVGSGMPFDILPHESPLKGKLLFKKEVKDSCMLILLIGQTLFQVRVTSQKATKFNIGDDIALKASLT